MAHSDELLVDNAVVESLAKLTHCVRWIGENYRGLQLPATKRDLIANGCLDLALEHQMAIEVLARHGLYGSLLATLRMLLEALIRGIWFARCASEAELVRFERTDGTPGVFEKLVTDVEAAIGHEGAVLLSFKNNVWKAMNSFTHCGMYAITRRNGPGTTGPNYTRDDVLTALKCARALGILTAIETATSAKAYKLAMLTMDNSRSGAWL